MHELNAFFLMILTDDGIEIDDNDMQFSNVDAFISFKEEGIEISNKEAQEKNANNPIFEIESFNDIFSSDLQQ